jgi:FAD/FMN-containing dehydrogenase
MFWQIRRASYSLSKLQDPTKRPAAFLEDTTVPAPALAKYFAAIKTLLKKYNLTAAVHGHGGNGHLHFYPLIDFTNKTTPALIEKIADEFFATAVKLGGNLCGEHNDGIIRTPHLGKMFSKETISLFEQLEHIFDPDDIFNPGKKVHPRFDIKANIRHTN